nr:MAG TPA: hypothetical protein [Caudoviricetes sp.]
MSGSDTLILFSIYLFLFIVELCIIILKYI